MLIALPVAPAVLALGFAIRVYSVGFPMLWRLSMKAVRLYQARLHAGRHTRPPRRRYAALAARWEVARNFLH